MISEEIILCFLIKVMGMIKLFDIVYIDLCWKFLLLGIKRCKKLFVIYIKDDF